MEITRYHNAVILREGRWTPGKILVAEGRFLPEGVGEANREVDCRGLRLAPGFIDLHTHGGAGVDINGAAPEDYGRLGRFFASHGVTGWLASILTDSEEQTLCAIQSAARAIEAGIAPGLMGIHLEGPFLSPDYRGVMPEQYLREGDAALFARYQQAARGHIRYLTVAPEIPGVLPLIAALSPDLTVALGHSGADYETAMAGVRAGAKAATHTFNAMRPFHHREPGLLGAAMDSNIICEIIADGRHVHPAAIRLLLRCKGTERMIAVTDSMMAAGLPDGHYRLGINEVEVTAGDAWQAGTHTRAGSLLTLDAALCNLMTFTGLAMEQLLPLFTENPARLMHEPNKGKIAPGYDANFVLLTPEGQVKATYIGGKAAWADNAKCPKGENHAY